MTQINTASEVISFARKLEQDSARVYESLAQKYPANRDTFMSYARQNSAFTSQFESAYYSAISDALEGGFAFRIDPSQYELKGDPTKAAGHSGAVQDAIRMEDRIIKFYTDAAEQSGSLLGDVRRAFALIARKRSERKRHVGITSFEPSGLKHT